MRLALAVVFASLLAVPSASGQALKGFQSPSKNIGCFIEAASARCDIRTKDWKTPQRPKSCPLDYGQGLVVKRTSTKGRFVCAGDTTLGSGAILAYGKSVTRGGITCTSRQAGITCKNAKGHGFTLSKQSYKRF